MHSNRVRLFKTETSDVHQTIYQCKAKTMEKLKMRFRSMYFAHYSNHGNQMIVTRNLHNRKNNIFTAVMRFTFFSAPQNYFHVVGHFLLFILIPNLTPWGTSYLKKLHKDEK